VSVRFKESSNNVKCYIEWNVENSFIYIKSNSIFIKKKNYLEGIRFIKKQKY
jgi:hypothetical protein